jgi:hypothetical protein
MKRLVIISVLFAGALFAAEVPQPAQGEQRQRPDPAQTAAKMMSSFDANKDGILSQAELTLALDDMRKNRPQRPARQGGSSTGAVQQASGQAGQSEQRPEPPPADKAAAQMIEKFSSSKTGLTQDELVKALGERRGRQGGKREGRPSREDRPPRDDQDEK